MTITDVKVRRLFNEKRLRALVSLTLDNELAVHDIKVIQGNDRLFTAMPSRRDPEGVFRDVVHPITSELRQKIEEAVLAAYQGATEGFAAEKGAQSSGEVW